MTIVLDKTVSNQRTHHTPLRSPCQALRKAKADKYFDYVLIERKSSYHHNFAALRGIALDSFIDQ